MSSAARRPIKAGGPDQATSRSRRLQPDHAEDHPNPAEAERPGHAEEPGDAAGEQRDEAGHSTRLTRARAWLEARSRSAWTGLLRWSTTRGAFDTAVCAVYLSFAFWISHGLWPDPNTRAVATNSNDQTLIEWFLAHGVLLWKGDFSLVTDRLNAPDGVNLMSNASHILHGALMAPVTALFGAPVSFALLVALNLAGTGAGWYLLFARGLGYVRGAAIIGGGFAGFAPGMISQSNSHLHMTAQWLVPPILWCVIRLTRADSARDIVVTSLSLSGLVCLQVFLGEEVLYLTALSLLVFGLIYTAIRWRWTIQMAPRFLAGGLIAIGICALALAHPLWVQLDGPLHTSNAPFAGEFFYADISSYLVFSPLSIAGSPESDRLATSSAEMNAFLGLPLLLVLLGCALWRWRSPAVVASTIAAVVMGVLSFGPYLTLDGQRTGWPSLYNNIADIPLVDGALPTRYSLAIIPLVAVVIAITIDAAVRAGGVARIVVPLALVAALIPALPKPLATIERPRVPQFITSGAWRECAPEGGVIVPVPLPTPQQPDLMRWPAMADVNFAIPEGFFIGPYGPQGRTSIGTYKQPTSALLDDVAKSGNIPEITEETKAQARKDLAYWKADCVALAHVTHEVQLRTTLDALLGPGTPIRDTWTWKVSR